MKKYLMLIAGVMLAVSLTACAPTTQKALETEHPTDTAPAAAAQQPTIDGKADKLSQSGNSDEAPSIPVCIYTQKTDQSGLKQNMDAIEGKELDAQLLMDKMAELGAVEQGIKVQKFDLKDGVITMDLSELKDSDNKFLVTAVANTFIQNYDAQSMKLTVNGKTVGEKELTFDKDYKKMGK